MPFRPRRSAPARIPVGDLALALVSYVPLLLTHRGKLGADTKTFLYLDPGKLLSKAPHLWDSTVGLGTITHQTIGYLFPMGPYYAVMSFLHVPDWIAQRLWMGTILFLAGIGVRYLLRTIRWDGPGVTVAAFAYALSPYLLHYIYKSSVILLPFTALPWLIALTARSLRQGGWRYPSLFALVTLASGGINATSLILVMIGPLLWVLHAVYVEHEMPLRKVWPPLLRIGLLTLVTSLWWMAGLYLQGSYGIDVLKYTETYKTVASASSPPEIFRSLGYWFLYGTDNLGPWFKATVTETQSLPQIAISFGLPIVAIIAALLTRFRYRVFFIGLAVAGMVVSVGAHPFDHPTWYGRIFNAFTNTSAGLALRSSPRALPMWDLALAVFLGAGVAALARWQPKYRVAFAGVALLAIVANLSPLWMGRLLDPYLERSVDAPQYWKNVGKYLDGGDRETRALEAPGIDFANYRWGVSVDDVLPGLTDRDTSARELVPWGSDVSADLTNAVDGPFQSDTFDPSGYGALLGNMAVGDLVLRNDLQYERYKTPRPKVMQGWIAQAVADSTKSATGTVAIGPGKNFGPDTPNRAVKSSPMIDATDLSIPDSTKDPHAVVVHPVTGATPEVAAFPTAAPTIVAGSGDGLVSLANAGLLHGLTTYSGSVTNHPSQLSALLKDGATLAVTDSNRKAGQRWGSLRDQLGYTEMADEKAPADPSDDRLDLFPGREKDTSVQTVEEQTGGLRVTASGYGNQLNYTPSDRAANAFDGDPSTGWKVGAFSDVRGDWIQAKSTTGPITADHIGVVQAQRAVNRHITKVRLTFDGKHPVDETLAPSSYGGAGQVLHFPSRTFTTLRVSILATDLGVRASYKDISGVGFTQISLADRTVHEVARPPTDLLDAVGTASAGHPLDYLFARQQTDPKDDTLQPAELRIVRQIDPPTARAFTVSAKARLASTMTDPQIDAVLGQSGPVSFASSSRLPGNLTSRASKAFDGDPSTSWQSDVGDAAGSSLTLTSAAPMSLSVSGLTVVNDSRHSIPTAVHLVVNGVAGPTIELSGVPAGPARQGTKVSLTMAPQQVTGTSIALVVDRSADRTNLDWNTHSPDVMPLAIAEVTATQPDGTPLRSPTAPKDLPSGCRTDLVTIGSAPVPLQVSGTTAAAQAGDLLTVSPCGAPTEVSAAKTVVSATDGRSTGLDVDELNLESPAAGSKAAASTGVSPSGVALDASAARPTVRATRPSSDSYDVSISGADRPFWLVLSQTQSPGWALTVNGHQLGASKLVNGYANGWLIDPAALGAQGGRLTATIDFAPQSTVWIALLLSAVGSLVCVALLFFKRFRGAEFDLHRLSPSRPVGINPLDSFGTAPALRSRLIATALVLVGTTLIATWWGPIVAAATYAALSTKWGWAVLRALVVGLLGATALYVLARQFRGHFLDDFDWPQHFDAVTSLPLAAFAGLAAEAVVEALRAGWRRDAG